MTLKFVEVSLGHKYRVIHKDGTVSGGAIRYLSKGIGDKGFPKLGSFLALFFAICCIGGSFGGEYVPGQSRFQQIVEATGERLVLCMAKVGLEEQYSRSSLDL